MAFDALGLRALVDAGALHVRRCKICKVGARVYAMIQEAWGMDKRWGLLDAGALHHLQGRCCSRVLCAGCMKHKHINVREAWCMGRALNLSSIESTCKCALASLLLLSSCLLQLYSDLEAGSS